MSLRAIEISQGSLGHNSCTYKRNTGDLKVGLNGLTCQPEGNSYLEKLGNT